MQEYDRLIKVVLIGDSGIGKSSILLRYTDNSFIQQYISTIGVDFRIKTIDIQGTINKLQIWDTSGQQRFASITKCYYKGAGLILFVFDLTNQESFRYIIQKVTSLYKQEIFDKNFAALLVGNKSDEKQKRKVAYEDAFKLGQKIGGYIQISAKKNQNIDKLFYQGIFNNIQLQKSDNSKSFVSLMEKNIQFFKLKFNQSKYQIKEIDKYQKTTQNSSAAPGHPTYLNSQDKLVNVKKQSPQNQYIIVKALIVGFQQVGKSSILLNYVKKEFIKQYRPTIGIQFMTKALNYDLNGKYYKMQIWDSAGQQRFKTMKNAYFKGSKIIFIVYDITNRQSFQKIKQQFQFIKNYWNNQYQPYISLLGNKKDLEQKRVVSTEQGMNIAEIQKCDFSQISAKDYEQLQVIIAKAIKYVHQNGIA